MSPKQKAFNLFAEFASRLNDGRIAKRCALIAVDEILEFEKTLVEQIKNHVEIFKEMQFKTESLFWEEVKEEIKKI